MSEVNCFLCASQVDGDHFPLESFQLSSSKRQAVDLLSELLGEQYFMVCGEESIICRSCVNVLDKFDLLQQEASGVKKVVVGFLEKKFHLEEGTLSVNQPKEDEEPRSKTFLERKRAAEEMLEDGEDSEDPRSRIWMQCDSCEYICNYTSFVKRHVKTEACLYCGMPLRNGSCSGQCPESKSTVSPEPLSQSVTIPETSVSDVDGEGKSETFIVPDATILHAEEDPSIGKATYYQIVENGQIREVLAIDDETSEGGGSYIWEGGDAPPEEFLG